VMQVVRVMPAKEGAVPMVGSTGRDILGFNGGILRGVCFGVWQSGVTIFPVSVTV
jgi:hypothetical protein